MTLDEVEVGSACTVTGIEETGELRRRIMDMGITEGARIQVHKRAPLGDPIDLIVRGYHLSLRKADAAGIAVQPAQ